MAATDRPSGNVGDWHPDHPDRVAARAERDARHRAARSATGGDVGAEVAAVLAAHRLHASMNICTGCDWRATAGAGSLADQHDQHRADASVPVIDKRVEAAKAEAVTTLAMQFRQRGLDEAAQIALDIAAVLAGGREGDEQ